jgi:hypothetical protein
MRGAIVVAVVVADIVCSGPFALRGPCRARPRRKQPGKAADPPEEAFPDVDIAPERL